jgi:hypothetical protein
MQKVRTLSAVVALSSPLVIGIGAFAPRRQETRAQPNALDATTTRRQWLLTFSILAPEALVGPSPASGLVFFDPDRYGDKELKIAVVNKIRQNVRDVIVAQPELAPQFLQLAIQDGLTYNAKDQRGGPDGSIISAILSKDSPADLAFLITASEVLVNLKAKLKKSTEISMADLVTFAGAEAIEVTGGSRVVVQLGKLDPQASFAAKSYPSFDSAGQIIDAFAAAGLTQREVAILFGAVGAMSKVVAGLLPIETGRVEENEMGDAEANVPTSFGAPSDIYGKRLGRIDNSIFQDVMTDLENNKVPFSPVFGDSTVAEWASKYANKQEMFARDLPEAYNKLIGLGRSYTGGKVESLLGTGSESSD